MLGRFLPLPRCGNAARLPRRRLRPCRPANAAYRLDGPLPTLPELPADRRIMVFDKDLVRTYDSLVDKKYNPENAAYLLLI